MHTAPPAVLATVLKIRRSTLKEQIDNFTATAESPLIALNERDECAARAHVAKIQLNALESAAD